ncbi:hypothetical protein TNCV_3503251 [Trichonephila clavipes]|uniref:Uncharacterized protein n=1 Tax=Trichonephila clavipes TaxID=2585209 RepID=A0A8X6RWK4_TRICX|nr:hypothetical protein TNCV_3503251 [Trichonephila clavipes]
MVILNELRFERELLSHHSQDLSPSNHWLFSDIKRMQQGKRFGFNEAVIAEVEAYFESNGNSFYEKGIKK